MVMPREWYDYCGLRGFDSDWNALMARWKCWKSPVRAWQQRQRDKQLDAYRAWWHSLSKRERDYWIGRRADGEFPNILQAAMGEFKGPKYQRGTIQMAAFGVSAGAVLTLSSANNTATNIDFFPPDNLYAAFQFTDDGDVNRDNTGDDGLIGAQWSQINSSTDWIRPASTDIGDGYEIKWNITAGAAIDVNDESFTEDTWTTMTVDEHVRMAWGTGVLPAAVTFEIDIGVNGTSTSKVNQDYVIQSGDLNA